MKNLLSSIFTFSLILFVSVAVFAQEYGIASYYSDEYHGRKTAYGDTYNKNELTAAHKKHPYGTYLKITRLDNKKSVTVKVTDKGPYIKGRVVDVSRKAAERLGLIQVGMAEVKVEVVKRGESKSSSSSRSSTKPAPKKAPDSYEETSTSRSSRSSSSRKETLTEKGESSATPKSSSSSKRSSSSKSSSTKRSSSKTATNFTSTGLYKINIEKPNTNKGYGVQILASSSLENTLKKVAELQGKWFDEIMISMGKDKNGAPLYKIIIGQFDTEKAASTYRSSLAKKHRIKGFVTNLEELNN